MSTSETQRYAILSSCSLLAAVFLFWFSTVSDGPVTSAAIGAIGGALLAIAAGLIWRLRRVKNLSGADAAMIDRVMRNQKGFVPVSFVSLAVADAETRQGTSDDALQRDLKASALSATSAAMMLADADFRITFVNGATRALLTENEDQIRQAVPNFRADRIVGQPMDLFHSGGNRARKYLSDPSNRMRWVAPAPPASNVPKCSCYRLLGKEPPNDS